MVLSYLKMWLFTASKKIAVGEREHEGAWYLTGEGQYTNEDFLAFIQLRLLKSENG